MEFLTCNLKEAAATIGFAIFLFLYCFLYKLKSNRNRLKLPPGPRPWPLIGNLNLLGNLPHHSLTALARKYGPIMFLRLGSIPTLVVSSPAMAKEFLKTHDLVFANRPNCAHGKYVCYDHKDLAFSPYGEYWRQMRKLCTVELLTVKRIESFRFEREEEVAAMIASIWQESRQGAKGVDVRKMLSSLTQNITCRMFASRTYSDNELNGGYTFKEMVQEITSLAGTFCVGEFIPSLDWVDVRGIRSRMQAIYQIFDIFAENVIEEHVHWRLAKRNHKERDRVKDFVDVMLDMAEMEGQTISLTHIKAIILVMPTRAKHRGGHPSQYYSSLNALNYGVSSMDLLTAGMDTSSILVEWAMSELLRNPSTLARAQKEIESAIGRDRKVNESDVMRLDYLRCVVKETFRLHPPVPLLIPHESMEGCSVGGYFIPPKTRLYVNVWAIGRDENVWKDAHLFKPERFMGSSKDVRGQDFDLLPFGTGRRGCPGISMGLSVSELALAQLIHCFHWTVDGEINMAEGSGITRPRKNPLFACPKWRLIAEYPV